MPLGVASLILFVLALLPMPKLNPLLLSALPISALMTSVDLMLHHCLHHAWLVDSILPKFLSYSSLSTSERVFAGVFYSLAFLMLIGLSLFLTLHIIRSKPICGGSS